MARTIRIKLPSIQEVDFDITTDYEDLPVRGYAMASGDDSADKAYEDEIIQRLDNNDVWAWCYVRVRATWREIEGVDYLGCCCFENQEDFIQNSGYYEDMKQVAYNHLISQIEKLKG